MSNVIFKKLKVNRVTLNKIYIVVVVSKKQYFEILIFGGIYYENIKKKIIPLFKKNIFKIEINKY